jgi:hypothetical protein
MNIQTINRAFVYNKGLILHEKSLSEASLQKEEELKKARAKRAERKRLALIRGIQSTFKKTEKFVKEIFAEPSALSRFLIEKVLSQPSFIFLNRYVINDNVVIPNLETSSEENPIDFISGAKIICSGFVNKEAFEVINIAKIESLSDEKKQCFVALIILKRFLFSGQKNKNDLQNVSLVIYEDRIDRCGFRCVEEIYISHPPANMELLKKLKSLNDPNFFCRSILEMYQNLIAS